MSISTLAQKNLLSEMLYEDIYNNIDLQCIVTSLGIKENFIIKNQNVQNEFVMEYYQSIAVTSPSQQRNSVLVKVWLFSYL